MSKIIAVGFIAALLLPATHAAPPGPENQGRHNDCSDYLPEYRHGGLPPRHGDHLFADFTQQKEELHLTSDQIEKFKKLNNTYLNKIEPVERNIRKKSKDLHKLLQEDAVNLKKVRRALESISADRVELSMLKIMHRLEADKILTMNQKNVLRSLH